MMYNYDKLNETAYTCVLFLNERELVMKRKMMNKQLIKAIAVGLSASMVLQPVTALAIEGDGDNLTEGNEQQANNPSEVELVNNAEQAFDESVNDSDMGVEQAVEQVNESLAAVQDQFTPEAPAADDPVVEDTKEAVSNPDLNQVYDNSISNISQDAQNLTNSVDTVQDDITELNGDVQTLNSTDSNRKDAVDTSESVYISFLPGKVESEKKYIVCVEKSGDAAVYTLSSKNSVLAADEKQNVIKIISEQK